MKIRLFGFVCLLVVLTGCAVASHDDSRAGYRFGAEESAISSGAEARLEESRFAAYP